MITLGSYKLYDLFSNKIGGALTGMVALVVMTGVLLAGFGMIEKGIMSLWSGGGGRRSTA